MSTFIDTRGYRRFSDTGKLIHRHHAEQRLGRKLKPEEIVHHKDRNKLNNNHQNLWVLKVNGIMTLFIG